MLKICIKKSLYDELCESLGIEKSSNRTEKIRKLVKVHTSKGKDYEAYRWVRIQEDNLRKHNAGADKLQSMLSDYARNLPQSVKDWIKNRHKGCKKKYYEITEEITGHTYKGYIYEHPNRKHDENEPKERLQALILASLGFKVYLIEEPSTGSKKVDAIVNGVPVDFKKSKFQPDKNVDDSIQNNYQKGMKKYNCNGVIIHVIDNKPTQVTVNHNKVHLPFNQAVSSMSKMGKNGIISLWVEKDQRFYTHDLKKMRETHLRASPGGIDLKNIPN